MQWLIPPDEYDPPERDAQFAGNNVSLPSRLLLDYMYGVAAFLRWGGSEDYRKLLRDRAQREAAPLLAHITPVLQQDDWGSESESESDDPNDKDFSPQSKRLLAMDDLRELYTILGEETSSAVGQEMQGKLDEEALLEQQASILKVEEWKSHTVRHSILFSFFHFYNSVLMPRATHRINSMTPTNLSLGPALLLLYEAYGPHIGAEKVMSLFASCHDHHSIPSLVYHLVHCS